VIVLDTHVLVWAAMDAKRLSHAAAAAIDTHRRDGLVISDITLWELAMLISRGRIQAFGTTEASVKLIAADAIVKPITMEIAVIASEFPPDFAPDPADRLIAATARSEGLALVTRDEKLQASPLIQTIW
jgi:PIN domain nuclease of toxin-antitoxin system